MIVPVTTPAKTVGPYSPAMIAHGKVFTSGQLGFCDGVMPKTIDEQTKNVLKNLKTVLETANSTIYKVQRCQIFIKFTDDKIIVNDIFDAFFGDYKPQKIFIEVKDIAAGAIVEIDAVADVEK